MEHMATADMAIVGRGVLASAPAEGIALDEDTLAITLYIVRMILRPYFIQDGNMQRERNMV